MKTFRFGPLSIDPAEYGSQGNAVLGIRGSGKSYTATELAEHLFDAGVPWLAFDPTGIWRFIRVPGKGKGYPVVVAGGKEGDLPLTVAGTPALVRASMENGISLVFDLHGAMLSKADWRRVVTSAVRTLLQENAEHGLRHVFIEEAAEFVPQRPIDWDVYAEIERLARVGGNSRLGYTLINQRSQEVNKAVLELCENVFLHRQRGKNALENLDKWLQVAGAAEQQAIIKSMPDLPTGQCWAWIGGDKPMPPMLIKIPEKNSFHPDRRVMRGEAIKAKAKPVDVGAFVAGMKGQLEKIVEEDKANNPKELRLKIAALQKELAAKPAAPGGASKEELANAGAEGWHDGHRTGLEEAWRTIGARTVHRFASLDEHLKEASAIAETIRLEIAKEIERGPVAATTRPTRPPQTPRAASVLTAQRPTARPNGHISSAPADGLSLPQQRILDALAWFEMVGRRQIDRAPVAMLADQSSKSSGFRNNLSVLSGRQLISYLAGGAIALTDDGRRIANQPTTMPATAELQAAIRSKFSGPQERMLGVLFDAYPNEMSREDLATDTGQSPASSGFRNNMSVLSSFGFLVYRSAGRVSATDLCVVET